MQMSDGLLRVFWPYDLPRSSSPGVIVGWRNSELDLFVLAVLEDVEVRHGTCVVVLEKTANLRSRSLETLTMPSARAFYFGTALIPFRAFSAFAVVRRCMF